jgi:hypothetical protein
MLARRIRHCVKPRCVPVWTPKDFVRGFHFVIGNPNFASTNTAHPDHRISENLAGSDRQRVARMISTRSLTHVSSRPQRTHSRFAFLLHFLLPFGKAYRHE